jgi:hypothetical protein
MVYSLNEKYLMCVFGAIAGGDYKQAGEMFREVVGNTPSYDTLAKVWNQKGLKPFKRRFQKDDLVFPKESCENHSCDDRGKYFDRFGSRDRSPLSNRRRTYG